MANYAYEAVDASGLRTVGAIDVTSQSEALRRIREMGLFPTKVAERRRGPRVRSAAAAKRGAVLRGLSFPVFGGGVKPRALAVFTRQLATLVEAGMPLLRGLRTLDQQEQSRAFKRILGEVNAAIESGSSLSEALEAHPRIFNSLYVNMVKAGEVGGALEITLRRLAEFMEKARKIKGRVKSAMVYPVAVLCVAAVILGVMMVYVVPRFQEVFDGLLPGTAMPAFTIFIFQLSQVVRHHAPAAFLMLLTVTVGWVVGLRTEPGRRLFDRLKLTLPVLGTVFRKAAISRFARTLGTLLANGVPVLQALTIVKQTAGNTVVGNLIASVHDGVKEGETLAAPLKASRLFPPMIAGMVDVGEQTGALPDMLIKIADNCDEDVDNAVSVMTSLLEPVMLVFLALVVGSIVIAMFLPLVRVLDPPGGGFGGGPDT